MEIRLSLWDNKSLYDDNFNSISLWIVFFYPKDVAELLIFVAFSRITHPSIFSFTQIDTHDKQCDINLMEYLFPGRNYSILCWTADLFSCFFPAGIWESGGCHPQGRKVVLQSARQRDLPQRKGEQGWSGIPQNRLTRRSSGCEGRNPSQDASNKNQHDGAGKYLSTTFKLTFFTIH